MDFWPDGLVTYLACLGLLEQKLQEPFLVILHYYLLLRLVTEHLVLDNHSHPSDTWHPGGGGRRVWPWYFPMNPKMILAVTGCR